MKVISGDKVWVQKHNLAILMDAIVDLGLNPDTDVIDKIAQDDFYGSQESMYEFEEYEGSNIVEFFKSLDFIVDYEDLKGKTAEEILAWSKEIQENNQKALLETEDKEEQNRLSHKASLKMLDLRYYYWRLTGEAKFDIPTEEPPAEEETPSEESHKSTGLLKTIKNLIDKK